MSETTKKRKAFSLTCGACGTSIVVAYPPGVQVPKDQTNTEIQEHMNLHVMRYHQKKERIVN